MTTDMSNGGEDLLLTWSSKVEELVDEDKTEEAINVLNDVIAKLEILDDAHTSLTLAAACDDIGRLYTKGGFSDKADSFFTKAFLIKQQAQQQQSGNFRNEISLTSRTPTNEETEIPKGITISEASTSLEEDWEAIADQSLMQSSSSQVTMEISQLSLENQSQTPKQHGRGAFTYGQHALYSDKTNEITNKESAMNQSLDGFAEQLHTREELKYGTRHVLVVCGFSPKIPTRELENLFEAYTNHGVVIRRVNDTVALAVFRNPASAREALKSIHSQYNIRALDEDDSLLSSLSAKGLTENPCKSMARSPFLGRGISAWDTWEKSFFDPWLPISRVWDAMDFSVPTQASSFSRDAMAVANTRVDWKETPEAHVFTADLPGLRKEDLKIVLVEQNTLRISGERRKEEEKRTDQWHRVEHSSGRFMRQFRLPKNVNVNGILAKLENGVLTVNAPKTQADAANGGDVKRIDIGSA